MSDLTICHTTVFAVRTYVSVTPAVRHKLIGTLLPVELADYISS